LDNWQDNSLIANSSENRYSDCVGYKINGKEYASIGSTEGIHFFEISNENKLNEIDFIQGGLSATSVYTRDLKVYGNYLYAVCDEGGGMQIIDLSYLPDSANLISTNDSTFAQVHNLFFDTDNALMYACDVTQTFASSTQTYPMQVYSVANPLSPTLLYSGPTGISDVHDAFVKNNIAYLNCGFDGVRVYDFSNPSSPVLLQNINIYPNQGFNHQGWLTPNGQTYIFTDETPGSRIVKCEVANDNTITIRTRFGTNIENNSVAHNVHLTNEFAFVSYYNEGLRIFDIRYSQPQEIAFYDTYLQESNFKLNGVWGVYAGFSSERIIISDRISGLYLMDFDRSIFAGNNSKPFIVYPNPALTGENITIKLNDDEINSFTATIYNSIGQKIHSESFSEQNYGQLKIDVSAGLYSVQIIYTDKWEEEIKVVKKLIIL